jgi:hypothetical protein
MIQYSQEVYKWAMITKKAARVEKIVRTIVIFAGYQKTMIFSA